MPGGSGRLSVPDTSNRHRVNESVIAANSADSGWTTHPSLQHHVP